MLIQARQPFELIGRDLMGPFPTSTSRNEYILVIIDYLTRWWAMTIPDIYSGHTLLQKVILRHSCLNQILSDQGTQFRSRVMQNLTKSLGIAQLFASSLKQMVSSNRWTRHSNKLSRHLWTHYTKNGTRSYHLSDMSIDLPFVGHVYWLGVDWWLYLQR